MLEGSLACTACTSLLDLRAGGFAEVTVSMGRVYGKEHDGEKGREVWLAQANDLLSSLIERFRRIEAGTGSTRCGLVS